MGDQDNMEVVCDNVLLLKHDYSERYTPHCDHLL